MQEFLEFTLGGISTGMIYAAIALSLVLIWRGTRVLNYAQGGMAIPAGPRRWPMPTGASRCWPRHGAAVRAPCPAGSGRSW